MDLISWLATTTQSTDVYRYLWDGMLIWNGVSVYEYAPNAPELVAFQNGWIFERLEQSFMNIHSPYPPVAQGLFVVAYQLFKTFGFWSVKLFMWLPHVITLIILKGKMNYKWWWLLALNPWVYQHLLYDAHVDGWVMLGVIIFAINYRRRDKLAWLGMVVAILTKIYPVVLLPVIVTDLIRLKKFKLGFAYIGLGLAVFFVAWKLDYLGWTQQMQYTPAFYKIVSESFKLDFSTAKFIGYGLLSIILLRLSVGKYDISRLTLSGLAYLMLAPVVYPWYGIYLLPLAAVSGNRSLFAIVLTWQILISPIS